jgi:hypothetical protein
MTKAMTKKEEQALQAAKEFDELFGDEPGFEGDEDSGAIPRIKILQKGSAEVDEDAGEYVEGAKPGMVFNTVTRELYPKDEPLLVVPAHYEKVYNEWVPREDGGGFVGTYDMVEGKKLVDTLSRDDRGIAITEDGNQIVDTREHFFIIIKADGTFEPVCSAFTSTKIKRSKQWWTLVQLARHPMDARKGIAPWGWMYELKTVLETKDQYTYYNWQIRKVDTLLNQPYSTEVGSMAKAFRESVQSGERKAAPPDADAAGDTDSETY